MMQRMTGRLCASWKRVSTRRLNWSSTTRSHPDHHARADITIWRSSSLTAPTGTWCHRGWYERRYLPDSLQLLRVWEPGKREESERKGREAYHCSMEMCNETDHWLKQQHMRKQPPYHHPQGSSQQTVFTRTQADRSRDGKLTVPRSLCSRGTSL